jgi:hypothetical protein
MSDNQIERVRRLCLGMPEAGEKLSHGEPTFFVRGKVFVMFANNHHNDGHVAVWVPVPAGMQTTLIQKDPTVYFKPPYVGTRGWVGIELSRVTDDDLRFHVSLAWEQVAPRQLLGAAGRRSTAAKRPAKGKRAKK